MSVVVGAGQIGLADWPLPTAIVVDVLGADGSPAAGAVVEWSAVNGSGEASPRFGPTRSTGTAVTQWTLGPNVGTQRLRVTVRGTTLATIVEADARPNGLGPAITSLRSQLLEIHSARCSSDLQSLFEVSFHFTDAEGDVRADGSVVTVATLLPNGSTGSFDSTLVNNAIFRTIGTRNQGRFVVGLCQFFGGFNTVRLRATLKDAAGNASNTIETTMSRPAGAS